MRTASKTRSHNWYGSSATRYSWCGGVNPLPADMPLGEYDLTLDNVVVGSRVHITTQDGSIIFEDGIAATSSPTYQLGVFGIFAMNQLRIKVRKASESPTYKPYETRTTAIIGAQSIYVSQIPDE